MLFFLLFASKTETWPDPQFKKPEYPSLTQIWPDPLHKKPDWPTETEAWLSPASPTKSPEKKHKYTWIYIASAAILSSFIIALIIIKRQKPEEEVFSTLNEALLIRSNDDL